MDKPRLEPVDILGEERTEGPSPHDASLPSTYPSIPLGQTHEPSLSGTALANPGAPLNAEPGELWCIEANIIQTRPYRPGGKEIRDGTRLFRGGAKVYIISAFWGAAENVTVIGHHRRSVKLICSVLSVRHLERFKVHLIYHPQIQAMTRQWIATHDPVLAAATDRSEMERLAAQLPQWRADIERSEQAKRAPAGPPASPPQKPLADH